MMRLNWDAFGISASVACAIHCALLPLFITSLPVFGIEIIHNGVFEYAMIVAAVVIGSIALFHGYKKHHHRIAPIILFYTGIAFLFGKQIWHQYQLWLLFPAVMLIVSAHFINYRYCRRANHCHAHDCEH